MAVFRDERNSKKWRAVISYTDYMGKHRQKTKRGFNTKKEAQAYEAEFKNKLEYNNDITLRSAIEEYFNYASLRLRESTVRNKKWYAKNLVYLENKQINEINPKMILEWQAHMKKLGKTNKTINQSTGVLYTVFEYACKMYLAERNPVKSVDKLPETKIKMDYWTIDEFNEFIKLVQDPQKIIAFKILFYSGIRYGELLGLQIKDIHKDYIDINKSYDYRSKKFCETKNKQSIRKVHMPDKIMKELNDYIDMIYKHTKDTRLFEVTTNTWLHRQIKVTCEKYGLRKIRVHDLRHSHASMLINNGVDVLVISERLGHKDPTTTLNTYSHLYKNRSKEAVDFLNRLV